MRDAFLAIVYAAVGATLLFAAVRKSMPIAQFTATVRGLGVPRVAAPFVAWTVVFGEAVVAVVLLPLGGFAAAAGLVSLGVVFAGAGSVALLRDSPVQCNCFGAGADKALGWRQLLILPVCVGIGVWLVAAPLAAAPSTIAVLELAGACVIAALYVYKASAATRLDRWAIDPDRPYEKLSRVS